MTAEVKKWNVYSCQHVFATVRNHRRQFKLNTLQLAF